MRTLLVVVVLLCSGCELLRERLRIESALIRYRHEQDLWYNDHKYEIDQFNDLIIP